MNFTTSSLRLRAEGTGRSFSNFLECYQHYDGRLLLLGDPGAGKTTTLLAFAREAVARRLEDKENPLPILGRLAEWLSDIPQPNWWMPNSIGDTEHTNPKKIDFDKLDELSRAPKEWLKKHELPILTWIANSNIYLDSNQLTVEYENNKVLLLLDGLDELGDRMSLRFPRLVKQEKIDDPPHWKSISSHDIPRRPDGTVDRQIVEDFLNKNISNEDKSHVFKNKQFYFDPRKSLLNALKNVEKSRIVMSSRLREYDQIGMKAMLHGAVILKELNDVQLAEYLKDYEMLLSAINRDKALRDMARTPLLLSLLTYAYSGVGDEIEQLRDLRLSPMQLRDKIFETYIIRRYQHEELHPNAILHLSLDDMMRTLAEIAKQERVSFAIHSLAKYTAHPYEFVEQCIRLHIIVPIGSESYRFIHLLLHDFFRDRGETNYFIENPDHTQMFSTAYLDRLEDMLTFSDENNAGDE